MPAGVRFCRIPWRTRSPRSPRSRWFLHAPLSGLSLEIDDGFGGHVNTVRVPADHPNRVGLVSMPGHLAGQGHDVVGVVRNSEPQAEALDSDTARAHGPDVGEHERVGAQDVHEDVSSTRGVRVRGVMVDSLEITGRDRTGDDQRAGDVDPSYPARWSSLVGAGRGL